jgi:hypothetical protein
MGLPGRLRRLLPEAVRPGGNKENTAPNLIPSASSCIFRFSAISCAENQRCPISPPFKQRELPTCFAFSIGADPALNSQAAPPRSTAPQRDRSMRPLPSMNVKDLPGGRGCDAYRRLQRRPSGSASFTIVAPRRKA